MNSFKKSFLFAFIKIAAFLFMLLPMGVKSLDRALSGMDWVSFFIQKKKGCLRQFKNSVCLRRVPRRNYAS